MAWTKIQSFLVNTQYQASPNPSSAVTLGTAVSVGDVVLLQTCEGGHSLLDSPTVADQLGNSWTRLTAVQGGRLYDATNNESVEFWYCLIAHAGTPDITFTPNKGGAGGSANFLAMMGDHFTGSDASSTLRSSNGQVQINPGTSTNGITSGSVSAQSGDLLWSASGDPGSGPTTTQAIGSGFSAGHALDATSGLITEYLTATGSASGTFTDATNGGGQTYLTGALAITPAGGGGGNAITDTESAALADTQAWNTAQSVILALVSVNDTCALSELAIAALGRASDTVTVTEGATSTVAVTAGDSAGLIEAASVPVGHAIVSSDAFTLADPGVTGLQYQDVETGTLADASAPAAAVRGTDAETVSEVATAATKSAGVITDTDGATVHESATATLGASGADATAMAEAIAQLLASLNDTDSPTLSEFAGPSFGGVSFAGEALGLATITVRLGATATLPPRLSGLADFG